MAATPAPTERQSDSIIDRCFDGQAAARMRSAILDYDLGGIGSMQVMYRAADVSDEQQVSVRATSSPANIDFNITQDLAFAVPSMASRSLRVAGGARVTADLVVSDGIMTGQSMLVGGEMVAVHTTMDAHVLLPGGARVLLPFLRLDTCTRVVLPSFHLPDERYDVVLEVGEARVVDVPAGRFDAIEVFLEARHGRETYFIRVTAPHFILSSVSGDGLMSYELVSIAEESPAQRPR
jgi:hypothetical protein